MNSNSISGLAAGLWCSPFDAPLEVVTTKIVYSGPAVEQALRESQNELTNYQDWAAFSMVFGTFGAADPLVQGALGIANCTGYISCSVAVAGATAMALSDGEVEPAVEVSEEGLAAIGSHLAQLGEDALNAPENVAMMERLQGLLDAGESATGADANFYQHELFESQRMGELMAQGVDQETAQGIAHAGAIDYYGISPYSIYAPEVVEALPQSFNNNWRAYWGLPLD